MQNGKEAGVTHFTAKEDRRSSVESRSRSTDISLSVPSSQDVLAGEDQKSCLFRFSIPDGVYTVLVFIALPVLLWAVSFLLAQSQSLPPTGQIFILLVLEFGGRILGYAFAFIKIPPMVGMLGVGLIIRNVPYIDFGKHLDPSLSSYVRQIALAVILVRAGLGLDLATLMRLKALVFRLAVFPTVLEAVGVAVVGHFLLDFPWAWAFILGFVVAPVSPAVVVPRLLALREQGYGVNKGISTFIIASAALDNIVAISLFGVSLGFALSQGSLYMTIFQGPLEVLMGLAGGLGYGFIIGLVFHSEHKGDRNATVIRALLAFLGGVFFLLGFRYFGYSGAGALACLTLAFTAECIWKARGVAGETDILCWVFYLLWYVFEPLLFGAIGCQIDLLTLEPRIVELGLVLVVIGSVIRFGVTFLMASRADLTVEEKLFTAISWSPKATCQAAIGPVALDTVRKMGGSGGSVEETLGLQVLTIAVLTILLTAPIGELGVMLSGTRLLHRSPKA